MQNLAMSSDKFPPKYQFVLPVLHCYKPKWLLQGFCKVCWFFIRPDNWPRLEFGITVSNWQQIVSWNNTSLQHLTVDAIWRLQNIYRYLLMSTYLISLLFVQAKSLTKVVFRNSLAFELIHFKTDYCFSFNYIR